MPDGSTRELTYTFLIWDGYDNLLDHGYTTALLLEYANKPGWEPPNAPFEMRFSSIIADTDNRLRAWLRNHP